MYNGTKTLFNLVVLNMLSEKSKLNYCQKRKRIILCFNILKRKQRHSFLNRGSKSNN